MSSVYDIPDKKTLDEIMASSYDIVVIDIYADWCQPCKYLAPKLNILAAKYSSPKVLFCKLNSETGLKQGIQGLPSIEFWVRGNGGQKQLYHTVLGADIDEIENTIAKIAPVSNSNAVASMPSTPAPNPQGFKYKTGSSGGSKQYKTYGKYT